ncbi:hypothetical protein LAZ67_2006351 [Cordylochernes scorpioides]|uniref:Retrovirus-related Pol polyprotein from transposon TNT 1-94-like beta-barrel domain-containing protein n=1 Tax=Cordylochernes scorpioides TaxID=51811 RepID=A0ABY6K594_9ARAC|nr:hypothetical protein LAZ67_2006351 [Cordylochernes scorpioides]
MQQSQKDPWRHGRDSCETARSTLYMSSLDYTVIALFVDNFKNNNSQNIWFLDSGATEHMTSNKLKMTNTKSISTSVEMANNGKIKVSEMGDVTIKLGHEYGGEILFLENVLYVPELDGNILSVGRIEERGNKVLFQNGKASVFGSNGELILKSNRRGRIYTVEELKMVKVKSPSADIWHRRLGHIYKRDLQNVSDTAECEVCLEEDTTQKDIELDDSDIENYGKQECPKRFSQPKLNDLTRDLRLSKQDAELLISRLKEMSQFEDDVNATFYRTRESSFLPFYQQDANLVYSTNVKCLLHLLKLDEYRPEIGVYLLMVPCVASNVFYFIIILSINFVMKYPVDLNYVMGSKKNSQDGEFSSTSLHLGRPFTVLTKLEVSERYDFRRGHALRILSFNFVMKYPVDLNYVMGSKKNSQNGEFSSTSLHLGRPFTVLTNGPQTPAVTVITKEPHLETGKLLTSWDDKQLPMKEENNGLIIVNHERKRTSGNAAGKRGTRPTCNHQAHGCSLCEQAWSAEVQHDFAQTEGLQSKSAGGQVDQCVYLEFSPGFSQALEAKLGKRCIYQLSKMEGHIQVGLSNVPFAQRLIEDGLNIGDVTLSYHAPETLLGSLNKLPCCDLERERHRHYSEENSVLPFLKEHEMDIWFLHKTNVMSLNDVGDLCHGYSTIVAPATTIVGSDIPCVFVPGVVIHRRQIQWPGKSLRAEFSGSAHRQLEVSASSRRQQVPAATRSAGFRALAEAIVGDFSDDAPTLTRSTLAVLLNEQYFRAFFQRLLQENARSSYHAECKAENIFLRRSATPITRLLSQRARRKLYSTRMQAIHVGELRRGGPTPWMCPAPPRSVARVDRSRTGAPSEKPPTDGLSQHSGVSRSDGRRNLLSPRRRRDLSLAGCRTQ